MLRWRVSPELATISIIMEGIRFRKRLKECRVTKVPKGVEVFCYKGEMYDREKFVLMTMESLQDEKYSDIKSKISSAKKVLEKGYKHEELLAAELSAYLRVLPEKKKPLFYIDDGL